MTVAAAVPTAAEPFPRRGGTLHCEQVPVAELVARWGTPLYVYSASHVRRRFRELDDALSGVDHLIAYSVKANGNLGVLGLLAEMGAGADIVSGGELHRALRAGIPADRIVFSGVGKTMVELAGGLEAGIHAFNVESEGELCALAHMAETTGRAARVALRVNPDVPTDTPHVYTRTGHAATKFGMPMDQATHLFSIAAKMPGVKVVGIDAHIGSQILSPEPYRVALDRLLDVVHTLKMREEVELEFVDVGGGLGVSYEGEEGISAETFAEAVVGPVREAGLRLVVEPGRFIVGEAGMLLARVLYVKEGGGKCFVITDAGMNDLLRPSHYSGWHAITLAEEATNRQVRHVDVVGPVCETGDFIALDREMPVPEPGELIAIHTVGAYGFSMASQYNQRTRPAEVLVDGGTARLVRRRETVEDLVAAEVGL